MGVRTDFRIIKTRPMKPLFSLLLLFLSWTAGADNNRNTGTISGQVLDADSEQPLPYATVTIGGQEDLGTTTDIDGYFTLSDIPVGRQQLIVSYVGYETAAMDNLFVQGGKELVLQITLQEAFTTMDEVVVQAEQPKGRVLNEMAKVSARSFSVEEAERYAGSRNDVARMATNFAGVTQANDAVNDIVIRGNSARGLLWRFEGVDIPNPNHFGQFGATGGPVSMLNNNVLANSAFYTGAFPAMYGNALAGVFDLNMRKGNPNQHEFMAQVGFNGFEGGAEGPLHKDSRASYLVNYRYSTLGVFKALGINFGTGAAVPEYQDVTFKLDLPQTKVGSFSLFGLGGTSYIELLGSEIDTTDAESLYGDDNLDIYNQTRLGVLGLNHKLLLGKNAYTSVTIAGTYFANNNLIDTLQLPQRIPGRFGEEENSESTLFAHGFFKQKFSARSTLQAGAIYKYQTYALRSQYRYNQEADFTTVLEQNNGTHLLQPYATWNYRVTEKLELTTGVQAVYFALNEQFTMEPRLGLTYQLNDKQQVNVAYGRHSQTQPLMVYFMEYQNAEGVYQAANRNLQSTLSDHFVVGYDHFFTPSLRLKTEAYYQRLTNIPVSTIPSSVSLINFGAPPQYYPDSLEFYTNAGTGRNYGVEFTLEQFMQKGLYYLATVSIFDSQYKNVEGTAFSTAFNTQFVVNVLGGKEFPLFREENRDNRKTLHYLQLDGKLTWAGGGRYLPIDPEASAATGAAVYQYEEGFSGQFEHYFRADIELGFKSVGEKITQEWRIMFQNVTNRANPFFFRYDPNLNEQRLINQLGLFIVPQYRIYF